MRPLVSMWKLYSRLCPLRRTFTASPCTRTVLSSVTFVVDHVSSVISAGQQSIIHHQHRGYMIYMINMIYDTCTRWVHARRSTYVLCALCYAGSIHIYVLLYSVYVVYLLNTKSYVLYLETVLCRSVHSIYRSTRTDLRQYFIYNLI